MVVAGSWFARKDAGCLPTILQPESYASDVATYIVPVLTYASQTWTLFKCDETLLAAFDRKPRVWKDNGGVVIMTSYTSYVRRPHLSSSICHLSSSVSSSPGSGVLAMLFSINVMAWRRPPLRLESNPSVRQWLSCTCLFEDFSSLPSKTSAKFLK